MVLDIKKYLLIIILLFLTSCSVKLDHVVIKKDFESEYKTLIERYAHYWECMSKKDFKCAYKYEMPYQRLLHDYKWYKIFNRNNRKNYKIILLDVLPRGKDKVLIKSKFISADNKVTYVFYDTWYNVSDTWYHKMKVSLLPFGGGKEE